MPMLPISDPHLQVRPDWRTSTFCGSATCIQVAAVSDGGVGFRDSKLRDSPILCYTHEEFTAFVQGVKAGEFDDLLVPLGV